jgi:hypothetical protein
VRICATRKPINVLPRQSVTPLEVAEHIHEQAVSSERDLDRLKISVFEKLSDAA